MPKNPLQIYVLMYKSHEGVSRWQAKDDFVKRLALENINTSRKLQLMHMPKVSVFLMLLIPAGFAEDGMLVGLINDRSSRYELKQQPAGFN